jgi:hypothetical protein
MGHANRPRLHDAFGLDAQSRRICLPTARRCQSNTNTNGYTYGNSNADGDRCGHSNSNNNTYCYSDGNSNTDADFNTDSEAHTDSKTATDAAAQAVTLACLAVVRRLPDEGEWSVKVIRLCQGYGEQVSER